MTKKLSQEEFLSRVNHELFDFSQAIYKNNSTPVKVVCKICHKTCYPRPINVFNGSSCFHCSVKTKKILFSMSQDEFISRSISIWGNRFDYSNVLYVNNRTKIQLYCLQCNRTFHQTPDSHLKGIGCSRCKNIERITIDSFLQKSRLLHGDKFEYDDLQNIKNDTRIKIKCKLCNHQFITRVNNHINKKSGCPCCQNKLPISFLEFTKRAIEIHGNSFSYFENEYVNFTSKCKIKCNHCSHNWHCKPYNHITNSSGCPRCHKKRFVSKKENSWLDTLSIPDNCRQIHIKSTHLIVDALVSNIIYEFYGSYYHGDPRKYSSDTFNQKQQKSMGELFQRTLQREAHLKSLGYEVKFVWEIDFNNGQLFSTNHPTSDH